MSKGSHNLGQEHAAEGRSRHEPNGSVSRIIATVADIMTGGILDLGGTMEKQNANYNAGYDNGKAQRK